MARENPERNDGLSGKRHNRPDIERATFDRRTILRLAGSSTAAAAVFGGIGSSTVGATSHGPVIDIDYDQYSSPSSVYRVWTCDPSQASFTSSPSYDGSRSMEIALHAGGSCGTNTHFNVENELGYQPNEIYDRFMFRLSDNWTMRSDDQFKILRSGMSYSAGGGHSGGGNASGDNGWSAGIVVANRGSGSSNNGPYNIAAYLYHMDAHSQDNDGYYGNGLLYPGRWHQFETHLELNSVSGGRAQGDGRYRIWVDGELIYDRRGLNFTENLDSNAIEYSGPYLRYGGGETAPRNMAAYFANHAMFVEQGVPDEEAVPDNGDTDPIVPEGDFTLELSGEDDLNEYLLELDAETVEPGGNANTHEHEYQDRAIEQDGLWYVHGYTNDGGIDDFEVSSGEILRLGSIEGSPIFRADNNPIDVDEYDSIESIPDGSDGDDGGDDTDDSDEDEDNEPVGPTGDFTIELGGDEGLNEYLLELDAEAVEPGDSANTHEHEFQDRAIEQNGYWYVHGYTTNSGIDDFHVTDGHIRRVGALEGSPTLFADDEELDIAEFDSIDAIPDEDIEPIGLTGDFTIELGGTEDLNEYLLELDAEAVEPGDSANTHEHEFQDRAVEQNGYWYVHGYTTDSGIDDFHVTDGHIRRVGALEGTPTLHADGEELDISEFESIDIIQR